MLVIQKIINYYIFVLCKKIVKLLKENKYDETFGNTLDENEKGLWIAFNKNRRNFIYLFIYLFI